MATEIPDVLLVLTSSMRMWHIAQPATYWFTLCNVQSRPPGIDHPTYSDVCKRCRRSYEAGQR